MLWIFKYFKKLINNFNCFIFLNHFFQQKQKEIIYRIIEPIVGFKGLGFSFAEIKGKKCYIITKVAPASPSEKSGLKVGEKLIEINGIDARNIEPKELLELMKKKSKNALAGS